MMAERGSFISPRFVLSPLIWRRWLGLRKRRCWQVRVERESALSLDFFQLSIINSINWEEQLRYVRFADITNISSICGTSFVKHRSMGQTAWEMLGVIRRRFNTAIKTGLEIRKHLAETATRDSTFSKRTVKKTSSRVKWSNFSCSLWMDSARRVEHLVRPYQTMTGFIGEILQIASSVDRRLGISTYIQYQRLLSLLESALLIVVGLKFFCGVPYFSQSIITRLRIFVEHWIAGASRYDSFAILLLYGVSQVLMFKLCEYILWH